MNVAANLAGLNPNLSWQTDGDRTMNETHHDNIQIAIWQPRWHRNDQSLQVGKQSRLWFFPSESGQTQQLVEMGWPENAFLLFNRTVSSSHAPESRTAVIVGIEHPVLGQLESIDTSEFDYVFRTVEGVEFIVNAEEEPGLMYDTEQPVITDWTMTITLMHLSDPVPEIA
jgi:hypothetical protein